MNTVEQLKKLIDEYDNIVIGAGAGLSTAAGFVYDGKIFLKYFKDMHDKYGYTDMYSAGFHHFDSNEEMWGYWCRNIYLNRYKEQKNKLYEDLLSLIKNKNYFVITTNVDHQFQLAGFDKKRLFYTQGDYGLFQCSLPCHDKTYDNKDMVLKMLDNLHDGMIPQSLIPKCPVCGRNMSMNLRCDDTFVEDKFWHEAAKRYQQFLNDNKNKKILFLELGVGFNTPVIIKFPFMRMTYQFKDAFYVCINKGYNRVEEEIRNKSLVIDSDIKEIIEELKIIN